MRKVYDTKSGCLVCVYDTDTDFIVCVYISALYSIVTLYDTVNRTHERKGTFSTCKGAIALAEQLAKQFKF